jgi:hypothetical protein
MKKYLFQIAVTLAISVSTVLATGVINGNPNDPVPLNPSQVGALYPQATNGTTAAGFVITNQFPVTFPTVPALILTASSGTITNLFVTTTNFAVSSSTTNNSIAWQAYAGYQRIQSGLTIAGSTNIAFPVAYTAPPVVQLTGVNTNTGSIGTITTTNFTINVPVTNGAAFYWTSFGSAYSVGPNVVNY